MGSAFFEYGDNTAFVVYGSTLVYADAVACNDLVCFKLSFVDMLAYGLVWCYAHKVMTGDAATGCLNPGNGATRAHMAKMITVVTRDVLG